VTAGGALGDLPDPDQPHGLKNHTYSKYKLRFNGYLGHRAIDPDMPAPTVTARGDNRGGVVVLHHPSNERRMSVRELATIQSFPVDFFFDCTQSAAYRLIGNAVAPRMGLQVALALREALQEVEQREIADDSREWQRPEPSPVPQIQVAVGNSPAH
jgi:DNA (cytosine-5)-methyltransferase 1